MSLTNELLNEIISTTSLDNFFATNHVSKYSLYDYLTILLEAKGLKQADVIKEAGINYTYGYEIFTGRKTSPSRDIVIMLALVMKCNLDETNRLLKISNNSELYSKNKRDVILIYAVLHEYSILSTNGELHRFGQTLLGEEK
ncbi:MAG: helix-turn-helix transcriptional regulator [Phoenicibacter congonensis]|uniref:Helix-turn-helix transcriptional regulator n=1 Tax=Phoenicibacter congonensis TaxID=1944646 RepID=A0AA43RGI0_9ACTN|nr:helix-turn-helix transcriptional regulator [Phoenicibacter congonensis]